MRTDVLGVGFDDISVDYGVKCAMAAMSSRESPYIVTPNPEIVWLCRKNADLKADIAGARLVLPDGIGIVYGAKILKRPLKGRVPGIDFAAALMKEMAACSRSVFLFGAKPGVAELAAENLKQRYPGLVVCGTANGYFEDDGPIKAAIDAASPDLLLVCLGAPKQEAWMAANCGKRQAGVMVGLGGALDVFAGVVERAPEKWRKHGLEWLYRLKKEPRRIKRMIKLPLFLGAVVIQRLKEK